VYQRQFADGIAFARWDGEFWYLAEKNADDANEDSVTSPWQSLPWRGRNTKPKGFK
jgi:hypothetical protein